MAKVRIVSGVVARGTGPVLHLVEEREASLLRKSATLQVHHQPVAQQNLLHPSLLQEDLLLTTLLLTSVYLQLTAYYWSLTTYDVLCTY